MELLLPMMLVLQLLKIMLVKLYLIRRGSCSFESKAVIAQNAGAIGVILMNNVSGVFNMTDDAAVNRYNSYYNDF